MREKLVHRENKNIVSFFKERVGVCVGCVCLPCTALTAFPIVVLHAHFTMTCVCRWRRHLFGGLLARTGVVSVPTCVQNLLVRSMACRFLFKKLNVTLDFLKIKNDAKTYVGRRKCRIALRQV